ncbi:hypothetical protein PV410_12770 [Streptomyces sp. PA03-5A]|nr:hypothetical protein [Streptomyces sp. PA03-5A]
MQGPVKRSLLHFIKRAGQNAYVRSVLEGASTKVGTTAVGLIVLWWQTRH